MSDQTPAGRWSVLSKWNPLDFIMPHGPWRADAWDRYFYNEAIYDHHDKKLLKQLEKGPIGINLGTEEGRRKFE